MDVFLLGLNTVIPILIMMVAGYILKTIGIINDQMNVDMSRLYNMLLLPCALFVNGYTSDVRGNINFRLVLFGIAGAVIYAVIGRMLFPPKEGDKQRFAYNHAIYRANIALFGLAVAESMYPDADLSNMVLYIALVAIVMAILCEVQLARYGGKQMNMADILKKVVTSPMVIASLSGLVFSIIRLPIPGMILKPLTTIGKAATPIGFITLGASLKLSETKKYLKPLTLFVVLRQIVAPALFLAAGCGLMGFRGLDTVFIIALLGCPPAVVTFAIAKAHQDVIDADLAGQMVAFTTLLAVFTMLILIIGSSAAGIL